jgi:hypothetical protein
MTANHDGDGAAGSVDVGFDVRVDPVSFTPEDVTLTGPDGPIVIDSVEHVENNTWRIHFARQTTSGTYDLTVGPEVTDLLGSLMDQNGDGVNGDDRRGLLGRLGLQRRRERGRRRFSHLAGELLHDSGVDGSHNSCRDTRTVCSANRVFRQRVSLRR